MNKPGFYVIPIAALLSAVFLSSGCEKVENDSKHDLALMLGTISSCTAPGLEAPIEEVFDESSRPNLELHTDPVNNDYYFCTPWNYEKAYNAGRKYPLLIYLHGRSQNGYIRNLFYMGYDNSDGYMREAAGEFKKNFPCFIYVPQEAGSSFDTTKLTNQIDALRASYRIDDDRLYVHGFSMGGYGTYALANDYYENTGRIFAGIIMLTGWAPTLNSAVAAKAGIWLMVGLQDDPDVVSNIRDAYSYLKDLPVNAGAIGIVRTGYPAGTHSASTWTLKLNCREIVMRTEFPFDGHFITEFPFSQDPSVMAWLFSQSLRNR
jgi:predicted peptidase